SGSLSEPDLLELAGTARLILDELIKRQQGAFFAVSYERGRAILRRSAELIAPKGALTEAVAGTLDRLAPPNVATLRATFGELSAVLAAVVDHLAARPDLAARQLLEEIVAWEADLAGPYDDAPGPNPADPQPTISRETLERYLRSCVPGWEHTTVENFRRLPGGYSKITILFDARDEARGRQSLVLRAAQHGTPFFMDGADIGAEFPALRYAFEHGVPVAEPIHVEEDPARLGAKFLISSRAPGRNYGSVISGAADLSPALIRHLVGVLARIHATPLDRADPVFRRSHFARWAEYRTLAEFAPAFVDYWTGIADRCNALSSPGIRRGLAWLRANPPESDQPPVLVHGDFGLHNAMIDEGRVTAVLDWEASHIGDPADEFFLFSHAVAGVVDRPTLMRWYEEAGGQKISAYRLRYFDVLNCLKGPIVGYGSLNLAERHPTSDIKVCLVGLQYVALPLKSLNAMISLAESLPRGDG
ncbi:MAG TPA: phosphotransferase family protein, partial [Stellaceae bacterium]|nr:phosphotransferase family protein [Stellaceae bacterium]